MPIECEWVEVVGELLRASEHADTHAEVPDRLALDIGLVESPAPVPNVIALVNERENELIAISAAGCGHPMFEAARGAPKLAHSM